MVYMKWIAGLCLGVLLSFFMRDLARPGLPMMHDSNPHISRMIAFHTALQDGQFPPMWAKEVLGGIGSPVMMLNYQLPYFMTEGMVRLGVNYFDAYKLVLGLSFIISGLLIYLALVGAYGKLAAWTGALIYTLAPYRFVDVFVRGALGESLSFVFPPLLILGYFRNSMILLALGWAGLFLTHPVASAIFSAFFLGYAVIFRKKFYWGAYVTALMIAAFNLLPALTLTKYTFYSPALSDTLLMFPTLSQLIYSPWGYGVSLPGANDGMSFAIGSMAWIVLLLGGMWAVIKRDKVLGYLGVASLLAILLILPLSQPLYQLFLGEIIDFPWRLLMCIVFASAWMASKLVSQLAANSLRLRVVAVITLILVAQSLPMAHTNKYWGADKDVAFFARETGDSYGEYAPRTRATRDSAPFGKRAEFVEGSGEIVTLVERSNRKQFLIKAETDGLIRINTAYFPGWVIPVDCVVTQRTLTHIDDSGLIACPVKKGESTLRIDYVTPTVQRVGNLITLLGIGAYLWILCRSYYPRITNARR